MRRDELAAVREQGVEARHLERRHEQVSLADRELDRVSRLPELVDRGLEVMLPPRDRRHEARRLTADVRARGRAEAEEVGPALQRLAAVLRQGPERVAELVEV